MVTFTVNRLRLEMVPDSRSPVSRISEDTYQRYLNTLLQLAEADVEVKCFHGPILAQGTLTVEVYFGGTTS